jgi:DNA repair exonuclease SbcCD ATPase subunit
MAMLAQGQFASFLTGDKKERESILEQLTNTEHFTIYGEAINRLYKQASTTKQLAQVAYNTECSHTLPAEVVETYKQQLELLETNEQRLNDDIKHIENKINLIDLLERSRQTKDRSLEQKLCLETEKQSDNYRDKINFLFDWENTVTERQRLTDLCNARKALAEAQNDRLKMQEQYVTLVSDLQASEEDIKQQETAIQKEKTWVDGLLQRDNLYTTYLETKGQIELALQLQQKKENITKNLEKEKSNTDELKQKVSALQIQVDNLEKASIKKQESIDAIVAERNLLNPEDINREAIAITKAIDALNSLKLRVIKHQEKFVELENFRFVIAQMKAELEKQEIVMKEAFTCSEEARKRSEEANARLTTMGESLKDTLVSLRRRLINEREDCCPLCGQKLERIYVEEDFKCMLTPIEEEQKRLAKESSNAEHTYLSAKSKYDSDAGELRAKNNQFTQATNLAANEEANICREATELGAIIDEAFEANTLLTILNTLIENKEQECKGLQKKQEKLKELQGKIDVLIDHKRKFDEAKAKTYKQYSEADKELDGNTISITRLMQELECTVAELANLTTILSAKLDVHYPDWATNIKSMLETFVQDARTYVKRKEMLNTRVQELNLLQTAMETLRSYKANIQTIYPECQVTDTPQHLVCPNIMDAWAQLSNQAHRLIENIRLQNERIDDCNNVLQTYYDRTGKDETHLITIGKRKNELEDIKMYIKNIDANLKSLNDTIDTAEKEIKEIMSQLGVSNFSELPDKEALLANKAEKTAKINEVITQKGSIRKSLTDNDANIDSRNKAEQKLNEATAKHNRWELLNNYFGGTRFRTLVQTYILRPLLNNANIYLKQITDRYELTCCEDNEQLSILVHDIYNKRQVRSATILSGGERFMISLALSLALSSLNRQDMNVNILFIDEGFGTLDEKNLESVMVTLEKLQEIAGQSNRRVGIISHREELYERIPTQIQVKRCGEGRSIVEIVNKY